MTTRAYDVDLDDAVGWHWSFNIHARDASLPELPLTEASQSKQKLIYDQARSKGLTVRQLYLAVSVGSGHRFLMGTPKGIAE